MASPMIFAERSLVCEHDIGHGDEIVVEERAEHVGFERLNQRREAGDIGKQRCDLAALSAQVDALRRRRRAAAARLGEK